MADCSYARCLQQRRHIRRELQRWTRNMVHIVGLERIAEELMGRRKWKLYQDSMSRNYLQPITNNNIKSKPNQEEFCKQEPAEQQEQQEKQYQQQSATQQQSELEEREEIPNDDRRASLTSSTPKNDDEKDERETDDRKENTPDRERLIEERLNDWKPESKCYFCVDGKLDSEHINHGALSPRNSDSDSTESRSDSEIPPSLTAASAAARSLLHHPNNNHHHQPHHHLPHHHHHLQQHHRPTQPAVAPTSMTTLESMAALAAVAALSGASSPGAAPVVGPHLSFYPPAVLPPTWYLNVARTFHADLDKTPPPSQGEQPLDLSSKGHAAAVSSDKLCNSLRLPTLDAKQIFNSDCRAKPRMSAVAGRRTYTEDELQAALRDIQSGKLGTRRAAVIYGIPRSTLRNKVYKLALERERESHLNTVPPLKLDEEEAMDDDKELSGAEEEKEVEKALRAPLLSMADIYRFSSLDASPETLKNFLQRTKEGSDIWAGLEPGKVAPYLQSLILASQNILASQKPETPPIINNAVPDFMKHIMAEESLMLKEHLKMQQQQHQNNGLMRPSPSNSVVTKTEKPRSESDMETEESSSSVILKIPSFRPTSSKAAGGGELFRTALETGGSMVSPPVTSESSSPPILPGKAVSTKDVRDVIAHSISQKFQQALEPARRPPIMEMDFKRGCYTPPSVSVIKTQAEPPPRAYQPSPQQQATPKTQQGGQGGGGAATGGKGTRPKRGKYRNYDRDSLVEAVRAVQRGEMSVHRAGSYYGVPHSTLEYKVKERHLMRPRKRDPKPNPVDEKIASLKQNDMRVAAQQDKCKPTMKQPPTATAQKFPPGPANGIKLPLFEPLPPGYNPPPFPFWPPPGFPPLQLEYGRGAAAAQFQPPEYFASQMMQKLQEESARGQGVASAQAAPALPKSARQMAESLLDGTGSNGSFLDGIIRSSLESGVPGAEEKSPKEERNTAPENMSNKALLDQLCRNSRLTPLSKPAATTTTEISSPGEDSYKGSSPLNFSTGPSSAEDKTSPQASDSRDAISSDLVPTIELSNDSSESAERRRDDEQKPHAPMARIYLKQELAKPENLRPEMLVRFRDGMPDVEENGIGETTGSASDD